MHGICRAISEVCAMMAVQLAEDAADEVPCRGGRMLFLLLGCMACLRGAGLTAFLAL